MDNKRARRWCTAAGLRETHTYLQRPKPRVRAASLCGAFRQIGVTPRQTISSLDPSLDSETGAGSVREAHRHGIPMLTLYSYPTLFGVADNNGYGLKVYAFLKLAGVPFRHEHIFNASQAPRGQLPYIDDDGTIVGDSETILAYVTKKYGVTLDAALTPAQRATNLMVTRTLDDLYWVMSYSRWKDERYWPAFRDALLREHPSNVTEEGLLKAKEFNAQRYHYQGIGRYQPDAAMARGLADLGALADLIPASGYVHGDKPTSIDAGIYAFIANIYFYDIDTPLKQFVVAHDKLVRYCKAIHQAVSKPA